MLGWMCQSRSPGQVPSVPRAQQSPKATVLWAGTPPTRAGCSELHPSWPWTISVYCKCLSYVLAQNQGSVAPWVWSVPYCCTFTESVTALPQPSRAFLWGNLIHSLSLFLAIFNSASQGFCQNSLTCTSCSPTPWVQLVIVTWWTEGRYREISPETQNKYLQWSQTQLRAKLLIGLHYSVVKRSNKAWRIPIQSWWGCFSITLPWWFNH